MGKRGDYNLIWVFGIVFLIVFMISVRALSNDIAWAGNNVNYAFSEDAYLSHNLSANITGTGANISFAVYEDETNKVKWNGTTVNYSQVSSWIFISNSSLGSLFFNATRDNQTGNFIIPIKVSWTNISEGSSYTSGVEFNFNVSAVNDAPVFAGLQNESFNMSSLFERIINVTDEENNIPFFLNITFINCSTAQWSTRNNTNCTLFSSSQYSFNQTAGILNISFTPLRNDVGSYIINFTARDSGNTSLPYNASTSMLVNFSVLNTNSVPYFTYLCDNERNATEDAEFTCRINVSDVDELNNLTISANYSWFLFNGSSNSTSLPVNITTGYNASFIINFTSRDLQVGNWSINISIRDTGSPQRVNSSVFWFFINNTEDLPSLDFINNYTIYENKTIYVNATDDDLLVPDKRVKNETLTFASNNSAVNVSAYYSALNYTTARITINFNALTLDMNHTIKINVTDIAGNYAERNFTVQVLGNNAPVWNQTSYIFIYHEGNNTYLNLSKYVNDSDVGDSITFSYTNDTGFPSFNLISTGIINFVSVDEDVGQHILQINASDGKLVSSKTFNFTVKNVNDAPLIQIPLQDVTNATVNNSNSNINTTEDARVEIYLFVQDDDFKIPANQKGFYNESLNINLSIAGVNTSLFSFSRDNSYPTALYPNTTKYDATFTPGKSDVGNYNITINVTDLSNASSFLSFNLTVNATNHAPVLMNLTNQTSSINRTFYYRINASDREDGNSVDLGNNNFTFSYNFISGSSFLNSTNFNSTTGIINITFNSSQGGIYQINMSVNDSSGLEDSKVFWIFVYDFPNITYPSSSYTFNLVENVTSNLTFQVNHSIEDNLTYLFYIKNNNINVLRYNISYYGNATNLTWQFTPNFTDETYGLNKNLSLLVLNPVYPDLNASINWNINISHTNYPVNFSGSMGGADRKISGSSPQSVPLSNYFSDIDAVDPAYNQTIGFTYKLLNSSGSITVNITNWTSGAIPNITFSASSATANYSVTAYEYNESNSSQIINNATSNNFTVEITESTNPTPAPTPASGGGGGTIIKPVMLKIILPEPISAYKKERIVLPIVLNNMGKVDLYGISLSASVIKNNVSRDDFFLSFSKPSISSLAAGKSENVTLTINIGTEEPGLYEITVNTNVKSPSYIDWAKLYLTVKDANNTDVLEKIVFTEELIAENPECIEIKEIADEARKYYSSGEYSLAVEKANEAIEACKKSISQVALARQKEKATGNNIFYYFIILVFASIIIGLAYYYYKRIRFEKKLARMNEKINKEMNEHKV